MKDKGKVFLLDDDELIVSRGRCFSWMTMSSLSRCFPGP
jgi:hypothetical protein